MLFGIDTLYIWVAVIIICVAVEAFTLDFSAALLVLVRPFCRRFLKTRKEPTNADRIIGETAIVTEQIDNIRETGAVKVLGTEWSARSQDDSVIPCGATVKVAEIRGVKAIVQKVG